MNNDTGDLPIAKSYREDWTYLSSAWELTQEQADALNFFNPVLDVWLTELSGQELWNSLNLLMLQTLSGNIAKPDGSIIVH